MKRIIIALVIGLSLTSNAQVKVSETEKSEKIGEFKQMGTLYAEIEKTQDLYYLSYRDDKYTTRDEYKGFAFREQDLNVLYDLFTKFDGIEKGAEKVVDLETGGKLYFKYGKMMGQMYAEVIHEDKSGVTGKLRWMTEKQIKKLFGKNEKK